jgi:hypothetical protein
MDIFRTVINWPHLPTALLLLAAVLALVTVARLTANGTTAARREARRMRKKVRKAQRQRARAGDLAARARLARERSEQDRTIHP